MVWAVPVEHARHGLFECVHTLRRPFCSSALPRLACKAAKETASALCPTYLAARQSLRCIAVRKKCPTAIGRNA